MLKNILIGIVLIVAAVAGFLMYELDYIKKDHTGVALEAPEEVAPAPHVPDDPWTIEKAKRNSEKAAYIASHQEAYDWFGKFAFSEVDGTPMIILKLLPLMAPDIWKSGDEFLSGVGLFKDKRFEGTPLPSGVGFSGLARKEAQGNIDYTSFTCGACHIGRVIGPEGEHIYIDGGVNSEFNIVLYFVKLKQTLDLLHGGVDDPAKRYELVHAAVLAALEKAVAESPNFFYNNYSSYGRSYDTAYESAQIELFKADSLKHVTAFVSYTEGFVTSFSAYLDKTYPDFQSQMLGGFPGMADATGVSSSHGYENLKKAGSGEMLAKALLPDSPGITDFMPVWEQRTRTAEWDETNQRLINGGGQYNGNIPVPIYRNLAASLTMGLKDTDVRIAAFGAELLDGLPATAYPFDVDEDLARKGEALYQENCEACHQPNNGKVYSELNTSTARSKVINILLMEGARKQYQAVCSTEKVVEMYGKEVKPCAEFEGVSLENMEHVIMRPIDDQAGYNATALKGVWSTAPYLHNGSVPTLHHLLVPETRPAKFYKGRLNYDQENVGYVWEEGPEGGYLFDTEAFHAFSRNGHDQNITIDGKEMKLNWADDLEGAKAIVEYMKTL